MTLPNSGLISIGNVSVEILKPFDSNTNMDEYNFRELFGRQPTPTQIAMTDGYGKTWITPGSVTITGTTTFYVNRYVNFTVQLWGGGGAGGGGHANDGFAHGYNGGAGGTGGTTSFNGVNAYGGGGGGTGYGGFAGSGDGGSVTVGGGAAGGGGAGDGGAGGAGGYVSKSWNYTQSGAPGWYSTLAIYIGGGGGGGPGGRDASAFGGDGGPGSSGYAVLSWGF